jgi:hypothetical protein
VLGVKLAMILITMLVNACQKAQIELKTAVLAQLNENTTTNMAKRQKFNLRSCGSSFKQIGATSPMKTAGVVIQGAKLLGTKMLQNKFKTAMVGGAVTDFSMQNNNQGFVEKALRTADGWTTGGVFGSMYDYQKNEYKSGNYMKRAKKDSENVYNVGKPKY